MVTRHLTLVTAVLLLAGCAVPLGPGFWVERQSFEVRHVVASEARLHVRASFRLQNTGNSPLSSIEVVLPDAASLGRANLRVLINDREVHPAGPGDAQARSIVIPFDPPWPQKQRRELVFEYDLAVSSPGHAVIATNPHSAHLRSFAWFPELLRPDVLFGKGGNRPEKVRVAFSVPADFRVLSNGRARGSRRRGPESEYRFELREDDSDPFLIAGNYSETRIAVAGADVLLWTFQPLPRDEAARAATRIAASFHTYESLFGRIGKTRTVWIVETPAHLASRASNAGEPAGVGFPSGALLNERAFALGVSSEAFLDLAEHELAHTWFGHALDPRPEADPLLSEGLAEYATLVAAEARDGPAARQHRAALLLRWYDEARTHAADKPLDALRATDLWEQRVFAYNKGALFFVALEDEFGKENVRRALARMVNALRGQEAGLGTLRSAIEGESSRSASDFFRLWLLEPGIPGSFRSRYEVKPSVGKMRFDLLRIRESPACISKGRLQDKGFNDSSTMDDIVAAGGDAVPALIDLLTDERKTAEPIFCYWPQTTVGDIAFVALHDLFLDSTWTKSTVPGTSFEEMLGPKPADMPFEQHFRNFIKKHGRKSLQDRWRRLWDGLKDSVYWDEKERCLRSATENVGLMRMP